MAVSTPPPGPRYLVCSIRRHTASVASGKTEVLLLTAPGDLTDEQLAQAALVAPVRRMEPVYFPNAKVARFGQNWLKLRAWELEEFPCGVLVMDADMVVTASLDPLLVGLPLTARFAMALDLDKTTNSYDRCGVTRAIAGDTYHCKNACGFDAAWAGDRAACSCCDPAVRYWSTCWPC